MKISCRWASDGALVVNTPQDVRLTEEPVELVCTHALSPHQLHNLAQYIHQHHTYVEFSGLSLVVNPSILQSEAFADVLHALQLTRLQRLDLVYPSFDATDLDAMLALDEMSAHVTYPVLINREGFPSNPDSLQAFTEKVTENMRRHNQERLFGLPLPAYIPPIDEREAAAGMGAPINEIKLKALMQPGNHVDVHVQVEEQHIEQQEINEVAQSVEIQEQQQEQSPYVGEGVDFAAFQRAPYCQWIEQSLASPTNQNAVAHFYEKIQQEFFGSLPHAMQQLSPDAARMIAKHAIDFSALNGDNLPQQFVKKWKGTQSRGGIWGRLFAAVGVDRGRENDKPCFVLDYDGEADVRTTNAFTPKKTRLNQRRDVIYSHPMPSHLISRITSYGIDTSKHQLDNIWVRYGESTVMLLLDALTNANTAHDGLAAFLVESYLNRVQDWSVLLDEPGFLHALDTLRAYDDEKLTCFKSFLQTKPDESPHPFHLGDAVHGFEAFWDEWQALAREKKVDPNRISGYRWSMPSIGNPVVYMERLLTILKNTRDLDEQLRGLGGFNLVLWSIDDPSVVLSEHIETFGHHQPSLIKQGDAFFLYANRADTNRWSFTQLPRSINDMSLHTLPFAEKRTGWFSAGAWLDALKDWQHSWAYFPFHASYLPLYDALYGEGLDHPRLSLEHHGAYYASQFEGFKVVSALLDLVYRQQASTTYREELDTLHQHMQRNMPPNEFYIRAYRFIALQLKGVRLHEYDAGLQRFLRRFEYHDANQLVAMSLFFFAHERYKSNPETGIDVLLTELQAFQKKGDVNATPEWTRIYDGISALFKQGTRLNAEEGVLFYQSLHMMNTDDDFSSAQVEQFTQKLLDSLNTNNYATLNYLHFLSENWFVSTVKNAHKLFSEFCCYDVSISAGDLVADSMKKRSSIFFALDTAEFLTEEHAVGLCYRDDLLLFSELINPLFSETVTRDDGTTYTSQLQSTPNYYRAHPKTGPARELAEVRAILLQGATGLQPNNIQCAYKALVRSQGYFTRTKFIRAFHEIAALGAYDVTAVLAILRRHDFPLKANTPAVFVVNQSTRGILISLLTVLERGNRGPAQPDLNTLDVSALQARLNAAWLAQGVAATFLAQTTLKPILLQLKQSTITSAFESLRPSAFTTVLARKIHDLADFRSAEDFEVIDRIATQAITLADAFSNLMKHDNFSENEDELTAIMETVHFDHYNYQTIAVLLEALNAMPTRAYTGILRAFFDATTGLTTAQRLAVLQTLHQMDARGFSSAYIIRLIELSAQQPDEAILARVREQVGALNPEDPLLQWMMDDPSVDLPLLDTLLVLTETIVPKHRAKASCLLMGIKNPERSALIERLKACHLLQKIIEVMAMSHAHTRPLDLVKNPVNHTQLADQLASLSAVELEQLHGFLQHNIISLPCLAKNIEARDRALPFDEFLHEFEKAPFGPRALEEQFSVSQVERVVNGFVDLNQNSSYPYLYRKQMMEAFLLVNRAGNDLPLYKNKPARALLNEELAERFQALKSGAFNETLDPFQRRLYALGLMREAMYRTTGQFPFSTQMLALIDCMMHQGDVISNIDTGQGKSLVDTMKAALLWLEPGDVGVDMTTSSLVDATRDAAIYNPFFSLLKIPHATAPISCASESVFQDYVPNGINRSTMAQFSLVYARAQTDGIELHGDKLSLVGNESDYTILDDRTVYRYAVTGGPGMLGEAHAWMYDAINDFVTTDTLFTARNTSAEQDTAMLKMRLKEQAALLQKNSQLPFIEHFTHEKLLKLINSALMVNYAVKLRENTGYVLTVAPELKKINGRDQWTRRAKLLMSDGKVSADNVYGEHVQQLLYAKLNKIHGPNAFVIEPESKTIISSNNKNGVDFYRSKQGFFWGSSGTVGSAAEMNRQHQQYGVDFSKVQPHQPKITVSNKPVISKNRDEHFKAIRRQLQSEGWFGWFTLKKPPVLVFFKDIDEATAFCDYFAANNTKPQSMQLFIGLGSEEDVIQNAALPGMITITTSALGRNTDIPYDPSTGMHVIQTYIGTSRQDIQKSGRTGRQGSPGEVHYLLNQADFVGSVEDARALLERNGEMEREMNEEFYNVLGCLRHCLRYVDNAFFKEEWSAFSAEAETAYRDAKWNGTYDRDSFVTRLVSDFNNLRHVETLDAEKVLAVVAHEHLARTPYRAHTKTVALSDCVSPETIAYSFLNVPADVYEGPVDEVSIKAHLKALFPARHSPAYSDLNQQYIAYLNASNLSMPQIRAVHARFLSEYLAEQVVLSNDTWSIKRWLGYEGHLTHILQDSHYLLLFRAMLDVREGAPNSLEMDVVKSSMTTLLQEYLDYNWFISAPKKEAAHALIASIQGATDMGALVTLLNQAKMTQLNQDIATNQNTSHSFFRMVKPVNQSGVSRFQNTLDRALALSMQEKNEPLGESLKKAFSDTLADPAQISETPDDFNALKDTPACIDKSNAAVIVTSMEKNRLFKTPKEGMEGREKPLSPKKTKALTTNLQKSLANGICSL